MTNAWPMVSLKEILRPVERPQKPQPGVTYRQLGVRLWGQGAYEREVLDGAATKYSTLSSVEADDVVVNKIWARNGSVAVVQPELAGCFVSGEFPTFMACEDDLLPRWMHWLTKTAGFWEQCNAKSRGTSGKNRIKPEQFLRVEIPLPSFAEQRRIVARIEALAGKVGEAASLQRQAADEVETLWPAVLRHVLMGSATSEMWSLTATELLQISAKRLQERNKPKYNNAHPEAAKAVKHGPSVLPAGWTWTTLGSVLTHLVDCVNDTPDFADTDTGLLGLKSTNIRPYRLNLSERWFVTPEDFNRWNRRVCPQAGDVVLTREAPMGNACSLPVGYDFCLTQRLMLLRPNPSTILPDLLLHYLNSPIFREQVTDKCRGLTTPHIRVQDAPRFLLPLPPMEVQRRVVDHLANLQTDLNSLRAMQVQTAAELNALVPSILDKAFKGEL